eukprot:11283504-Alexandrium_andersonii.AAC.1
MRCTSRSKTISRAPHPRRSGGPATRWRRAGADSSMGGSMHASPSEGASRWVAEGGAEADRESSMRS